MINTIKSIILGTRFRAINKRIILPKGYYYFDLGDSANLAETITTALNKNLPHEIPEEHKNPVFGPRIKTRDGFCYQLTLLYEQKSKEIYEKYVFIAYKTNKPERYWFTRGHEEGEALFFFGLETDIEKTVGCNMENRNNESVANLCGLHAVKIRNLDCLISERARLYYETAKKSK